MASKKKGGKGDFELDDDLDFDIPDFGGDNPEATTDDRKPITKGLKSAAAGFGKSFTSEARLRQTLTRSLPKTYEEPISKAFELRDGGRDLYNVAAQQVNETTKQFKRSAGRIGRSLEDVLPKSFSSKLKAWGDSANGDGDHAASKDEVEQGTIDSAFASIFAESIQVDADNRKKDNAREVIQQSIDKKRHADMTTILGSIDQSLIGLQTYQEKIGTNYMKKSLELQFRTYFIQNDMLQLQSKFFQQFKDDLAAITKNTGLPDYVKKAPKEALLELMRQKTFDSLASTLSKKRNEWLSGAFTKAGKKIKQVGETVRDAGGQILDTVETVAGMQESGMGPTPAEMAGDIAGGAAGGKVQNMLAREILKITSKNPKILKGGNALTQIVRALPQWVNKELQTGKYADKIPDSIKEILALDGEKSTVTMNREVDLDRAARWSDKSAQTLNIVIPELLSLIQKELVMTRTGNTNAAGLKYDYDKGKFVTQKERNASLAKSIVSEQTTKNTKADIDAIFKEIDPENTLDEKTRAEVARNIYDSNKRNVYFDKGAMSSEYILGESDAGRKASKLVSSYMEKSSHGFGERKLSTLFGNVGARNGNVSDVIQHWVQEGRQNELAEMGLLDPTTGKINMEAVKKMELGEGYTEAPTPAPAPAGKKGAFQNIKNALKMQGGNESPAPIVGGDLKEVTKLLKEAVEALGKSKANGTVPSDMGTKFEEAITKASGKTELTEIRDILLRIEAAGLGGGGIPPGMTPEQFKEFMKSHSGGFLGKMGSLAGKGIKGFANGLWKGAKASTKATRTIAGWTGGKAWNIGKGTLGWLGKKKDVFDLYVGNEVSPRLDKAKLEARKYMDVTTGKIIEKYEDIKGDIKDIDTDKIVLKATELKEAALRNIEKGKSLAISGLGWGKKAIGTLYNGAKKSIGAVFGLGKSIYGMGWSLAKKAYETLTDGPMDVYTKGNYETPVLLKRIMEQGLYHDQVTLDTITKVSQIKGAVVDNAGDVVLTKEDLANGLFDKKGKEIKTGFDRIKQIVGGSIKKTLGIYKGILSKGKDMVSGAFNWVAGLFGGDSPFTSTSRKTNDILAAIYDLLNNRMPGDKSPELDTILPKRPSPEGGTRTERAKNAMKSGLTKLKDKFSFFKGKAKEKKDEILSDENIDAAKDKLKDIKTKLKEKKDLHLSDENIQAVKKKYKSKLDEVLDDVNERRKLYIGDEAIDSAKNKAKGKLATGKDKVVHVWDKLYKLMEERLPGGKKKKFDDVDGDGVRDGSFEDLRTKREKIKDKAKEAKAAAMGKGKSIFGAGAEAMEKYFKKKGEKDDEDDDKEGDTYVDNSSDGEKKKTKEELREEKKKRRLQRLKDKKPKGKLGKAWQGLKGKFTPRAGSMGGKVLGGVGKAAGGLLKFGGKAAMFGLSSLIGGGLMSAGTIGAIGSAGMWALGAVGSVLGMAGTALAAVVSSPITVPALAIAAVAAGGYFAYKWLTKPDPQPIEKVRLVQYGWKADDIDAYKKMKSIEEKVKGAVLFKGETAEIDPKRLDIRDMMKVYDLDPENKDHAMKFVDWFANRFKPVYLNHRALIKILSCPKPLEDVDGNTAEMKKQYLAQCSFPGGHYSVTTSPYKDQTWLTTSTSSVDKQIKIAQDEVANEGTKKPEDKKTTAEKTNTTAIAVATAAAAAVAEKKQLDDSNKKDKDSTVGVPDKLSKDDNRSPELKRLLASTSGMNGPNGPGGSNSAPGNPINGPAGPGGQSSQGNGSFTGGINLKQPGNGTGGDINSIPIPKGNGNWAAVKDTIIAASKMAGVDPKLSAAITAVESGFDANARPVKKGGGYYSSAKGFNQFIDGTWKATLGKYGSKYGIDPSTSALDPRANALMGAEFMKENMSGLKKAVNRDLTATDVYIAHFMGLGGARKFLSADPNSSGAALFPEAAKANPWIYYKDPKTQTQPKMLSEIYGDFTQKLSKKLQASGYSDSDIATGGGDPEKIKAENMAAQAAKETGPGSGAGLPTDTGNLPPGTMVASPKPTKPNTLNNDSAGPTPSDYNSSSRMVASPKPAFDPNTSSSAPAPTARAPAVDSYYKKQSATVAGDDTSFMKDSLKAAESSATSLSTLVTLMQNLPTETAKALAGVLTNTQASAAPAPNKGEQNNYGKPPAPMARPSISFKRELAGQ